MITTSDSEEEENVSVEKGKDTKNIYSAINENNLPYRATTNSLESKSKENQFFQDVSMKSLHESGYEELYNDVSYYRYSPIKLFSRIRK